MPDQHSNKPESIQEILARKARRELTPKEMARMLMENAAGYEAIADPDTALGKIHEKAVADLLDPQNSPGYQAAEFGPLESEITEALTDPELPKHVLQNIIRSHTAGITTNHDGTHTLDWEENTEVPPLTINNNGEIQNDSTPRP